MNLLTIQAGSFPLPENISGTGTVNGTAVSFVGTIRDRLAGMIGISKAPVDPLLDSQYYPYGVSWDQKMYQIAATLESGDSIAFNNGFLVETAHAASNNMARVDGNYN